MAVRSVELKEYPKLVKELRDFERKSNGIPFESLVESMELEDPNAWFHRFAKPSE